MRRQTLSYTIGASINRPGLQHSPTQSVQLDVSHYIRELTAPPQSNSGLFIAPERSAHTHWPSPSSLSDVYSPRQAEHHFKGKLSISIKN